MVIFPLSVPGKIVLMLIAILLGLIWSMLQFPGMWKRLMRKGGQSRFYKAMDALDRKAIDRKAEKEARNEKR